MKNSAIFKTMSRQDCIVVGWTIKLYLIDLFEIIATDCPPETIPTGISEAYKTAESLRMNLVCYNLFGGGGGGDPHPPSKGVLEQWY
jgi:hypothetical protein